MSHVKINSKQLQVGDQTIPLLSGEVHYWRLEPDAWRPSLARVREMGLSTVATYICWDYHQLPDGRFDFHGRTNPRRNLVAFLDLLTEEGFWIILRPGPYIYSEWRNNGVPDEAAQYHRLHPTFLEMARRYMAAVYDIACPYFATNHHNGRVILFQADNEIDPWPHRYTEQLGLGSTPGPFHDFLRERYRDTAALNAAWDSDYTSLNEARAVRLMQPDHPTRMRRYLDFARFQHWYVTKAAEWSVNTYRELGVDLPIYLNTYSGVGTQSWAELAETADLIGSDIYPTQGFQGWPNEHRNFLDAVRYGRTCSPLSYIAELESGIWDEWLADVGVLTPNHYRLMCLSALLAGVAGWNWYMLVNRDNWYLAPINEWGRKRLHLFETFKQIVALYGELQPPTLNKLTSTAVTYNTLQRATVRPGQPLLQAIYDADIDYEFWDVERSDSNPPILFYAGGGWLSAAAQERLRQYTTKGGHLVCVGEIPYLDDGLRPHNALDMREPNGIVSGAPGNWLLAVRLNGTKITLASSWLFNYDTVPGEPVTAIRLPTGQLTAEENLLQANLEAGTTYTIGYSQTIGQGRLTIIGMEPSPPLLLALHNVYGLPVPIYSSTPGIKTAIFQRDQAHYLLAVNTGTESKTAEVILHPRYVPTGDYMVSNLLTGKEEAQALNSLLYLNIPAKDGTAVRLIANQ
jgi:hypothetical protein